MSEPTVLITGATGFIGGATAAHLLMDQPACRVILFVRAQTGELARRRAWQSLTRFMEPATLQAAWSKCEVIPGDLTVPDCWQDERLAGVTHVLHLAANTSFRSVRSVRHTNILGTLSLAHYLRRVCKLTRFLYVSTAHICGSGAPRVVSEDDFPQLHVQQVAEYTASKAECEMLLRHTAPELPLIIARPSVVVGHSRLGCRPSASIFWYYRTQALLRRCFVSLDTRRDVIPVDYAALALVRLLFQPRLNHDCYHISAGETASVTWYEIAAAFDQCGQGNVKEPYRVTDVPSLAQECALLRQRLGQGDEHRLLQALELYARFSTSGVEVFDNRRLLAEGIPRPPRFTEYLALCAADRRSIYEQMQDDD